jgi:hypothetical protein
MTQDEKDKLLTLFADAKHWCREAEARDEAGEPVRFSDATAAAWDLVGGLCHLFGWQRACRLFVQLGRHLLGLTPTVDSNDEAMACMSALIDFNDDESTTHELLLARLRDAPVWRGQSEGTAAFA